VILDILLEVVKVYAKFYQAKLAD